MKCERPHKPMEHRRRDWRFFEPIPDAANTVPRHLQCAGRRWGVDVVSPNIDFSVGCPILPDLHVRGVGIFEDFQDVLG